MHIRAPVRAGTDSVVPVANSIHTMPASAPGKAVMMMNGSSHDWKLTTITRWTSAATEIKSHGRLLAACQCESVGLGAEATRTHVMKRTADLSPLCIGANTCVLF